MSVLKRFNGNKWEIVGPSPDSRLASKIINNSDVNGLSAMAALNTLKDKTTTFKNNINTLNDEAVILSDEIITEKVDDWLSTHSLPVTIEDNSLTLNKFANGELGYVTPEQFGAIGDGETDDTEAIQAAINTHLPVVFKRDATYIIVSLTLYYGCVLYGNGATLKRPNLLEPPYNYSDNTLKWSRTFELTSSKLGGANTQDLQIEFRDLTFDNNAFAMGWLPTDSNPYRYEQAICIFCSGTNEHHIKVLIDNCTFLNHFASNVTASNYCDIIIKNSRSINCFKGICTVVGGDGNLIIENCQCESDYDFTAFWQEVNSTASPDRINININNCTFNGDLSVITSQYTILNVSNTYVRGKESLLAPKTNSVIKVNQTKFVLPKDSDTYLKIRGYGKIILNNCEIVGEYNDSTNSYPSRGVYFLTSTAKDYYTITYFNNCIFKDLQAGIIFDHSSGENKVVINNCLFQNITRNAIGSRPGYSGSHFNSCYISNCIFDINGYIYHCNTNDSSFPVFNGGNDVVALNSGFFVTNNQTPILKNEIWSTPVTINKNVTGFGKRTTYMEAAPTSSFKGINDVDFVELTVEPYTKYKYTSNTWTQIT